MPILPKAIYRFNEIPIKILMEYFISPEKVLQKFTWSQKKTLKSLEILRKKNIFGGITIPNIELY